MNIEERISQIKSQLEQITIREQANQQEQATVNQRIQELESELQKQHQRRNQLDEEAIQLYSQAEELKPKLIKLERIANLSQEFLELHAECQDNQDLLNTLYSSFSTVAVSEANQPEQRVESQSQSIPEDNSYASYKISIQEIKDALPNAEKIYQNLVAGYLEEYKTYQNYIVDGLDLIWYSVAFIAFGRSSYRKMSFKYHPDLKGSERAMQLINTAWSISQKYLVDLENVQDASDTL